MPKYLDCQGKITHCLSYLFVKVQSFNFLSLRESKCKFVWFLRGDSLKEVTMNFPLSAWSLWQGNCTWISPRSSFTTAVRLCLHTGESHVEVGIPECVIVRYLCVCGHVHKVSRECSNALTFSGNFLVFLFFCFFRKELCNLYVPPPAPVETGWVQTFLSSFTICPCAFSVNGVGATKRCQRLLT